MEGELHQTSQNDPAVWGEVAPHSLPFGKDVDNVSFSPENDVRQFRVRVYRGGNWSLEGWIDMPELIKLSVGRGPPPVPFFQRLGSTSVQWKDVKLPQWMMITGWVGTSWSLTVWEVASFWIWIKRLTGGPAPPKRFVSKTGQRCLSRQQGKNNYGFDCVLATHF